MVKRMVVYRLRQLQELGWTDEDLIRALKTTPEGLTRLKSGRANLTGPTELELGKILSRYVRKRLIEAGVAPPKPAPHPGRPPQPKPDRGVYIEEVTPAGETWYKIVTSNGKVGIVHLPNELVDAALYDNLCRRLEMKDKVSAFKII